MPVSEAEMPPGAVSSEVVVQLVNRLEPAARTRKRKNEKRFMQMVGELVSIIGSESVGVEQKDGLARRLFSE